MAMRIIAGILIGGSIGAITGYYGKCQSGSCPLTATPFRGSMYGAVMGVLFSLATAARPQPRTAGGPGGLSTPAATGSGTETVTSAIEPLHISGEEDFQARIRDADRPCLVDFFSTSCPPCRRLAPTIDKLAARYNGRAVIAKASLDGNENLDLAKRYGITGIPAVLFFEGGKEVERIVGLRDETEYAAVLDRLLRDRPSREDETAAVPQSSADQPGSSNDKQL